MFKKCLSMSFIVLLTVGLSSNASAVIFWKTGKVVRTLTHIEKFGGCMIKLSTTFKNGCPNDGWASFDCDARYSEPGEGQRAYATALVALTLDRQVSLLIDNTKKHNGYCVATRIDIR